MSLFITGTGTNVGKTVVTAALATLLQAQGMSFCVYKPIQTGVEGTPRRPSGNEALQDTPLTGDLASIAWLLGQEFPAFSTYCLAEPLAPLSADRERSIRIEQIQQDFALLQAQYATVLVEGAGGVRVPILPGFDMRDLMQMLNLPVLLVGSPRLGGINHALLSLESLQQATLDVRGLVLSDFPLECSGLSEGDDALTCAATRDALQASAECPPLFTLARLSLEPGSLMQPKILDTLQTLQPLLFSSLKP